MIEIDREFLYKLEICETKKELKQLIDECDNDEIMSALQEQYVQILKINPDENIENMKKIIIYRYRACCNSRINL